MTHKPHNKEEYSKKIKSHVRALMSTMYGHLGIPSKKKNHV